MNPHLAILNCAALLVPRARRAAWLEEWQSELWYVDRRRGKAIPFCLGAFRDALWMRRNYSVAGNWPRLALQSPLQCLSLLAVLAAAAGFFAFRVPLPRDMFLPFPYPDVQNLVTISAGREIGGPRANVSIAQYRSLSSYTRRHFSDFAFYRPAPTPVRLSRDRTETLSIAAASRNLFDLLQVPAPSHAGSLILSETAWSKYFDRAHGLIGRTVEIAGRPVQVAGILPDRLWRLPGRMDGWLLEDEHDFALRPQHQKGFVLARAWMSARGPKWSWRWTVSAPNALGDDDPFDCASLIHRDILLACCSMFGIALLMLPITTSLNIGEYPANPDRAARKAWMRRWLFLVAKLALLLPAVFFGTLDLAPLAIVPPLMLAGCLLAFRWALLDQRRRCPVCLRRLTGPVRVGCPSHVFLAWYGTELACPKGHGLMHVPEIATSSYSTQRWLNLDPSWRSLFS